MLINRTFNSKTLVNFRQWSGKGYAVFASLGKNVRIAVLKLSISESLSCKDGSDFSVNSDGCQLDDNDDWEEVVDDIQLLSGELLSASVVPVLALSCEAACDLGICKIYR